MKNITTIFFICAFIIVLSVAVLIGIYEIENGENKRVIKLQENLLRMKDSVILSRDTVLSEYEIIINQFNQKGK